MKERQAERVREEDLRGEPARSVDGRDVEPRYGTLAGEAGQVIVGNPSEAWPLHHVKPSVDGSASSAAVEGTYYDLPSLKLPVWKAWIPSYFYLGGVAGGAAALGAAAQVAGGPRMRGLVTRARWTATVAAALGSGMLIADLGRPSRFLYMMRVFRPTSPMNVGTWVLSTAASASGVAALLAWAPRPLRSVGNAAGLVAGVAALPLAGYTAVLIANTTVPIWNRGRRALPVLFVASAMASAASALELQALAPAEERAVRAFGTAGKVVELAASFAYDAELGHDVVRAPLRRGRSAVLYRAARALTVASLVAGVVARGRRRSLASGLLGSAAGIALRFAVTEAGRASARDPKATFVPQRAAREEREEREERAT